MEREEIYTLFIVTATNGLQADSLALYARGEEDAREKSATWTEHRKMLPIVTVTSYPGGLSFNYLTIYPHAGVIALPGQFVASIAEKMRVKIE